MTPSRWVMRSYNSTVYGGQGADQLSATTTSSITSSWLAGNRGEDKLLLSATTILNSTILGSDETGTLTGKDSLSIGAATLQTSTVYGGAGADTILFGSAPTDQIVNVDFNAFAGSDSLSLNWLVRELYGQRRKWQ